MSALNPENVQIRRLHALQDNYIWLLVQGRRAAVVDPGDASPVLACLQSEGWQLEAILLTHHHADHQGGVPDLLAAFPSVQVFAPAAESITGCRQPLAGGEQITVLGQAVQVMPVPGHTRGHLAYCLEGAVFCGDTLFGAGCGRLFEGTPQQMAASLATLAALPAATAVYCAHEYTQANLRFALAVEPDNANVQTRVGAVAAARSRGESTVPSSIELELATNPFLRAQVPAVIAAARGWAVQQGSDVPAADDPVAVFATLRAWRNVF